jgi:hypothetical protein
MAQAFGVVHLLVSRETAENGLPQHSDKSMPAVLAGSRIRELFSSHPAEANCVIEFAIGEQSAVGGHDRTAKTEDKSAVEIDPERHVFRFSSRVRRDMRLDVRTSY